MNKEKEVKIETTPVQFRTGSDLFAGLKGYSYKKKNDVVRAIKVEKANHSFDNDLSYLKPHDITMMLLGHSREFPDGVDLSIFTQLIWKDSSAKNYLSKELFKPLDLSNGHRNIRYNTRIPTEDAGILSDLAEKYFYMPHGDTIFGACLLYAVDIDPDMYGFNNKFREEIILLKDYMLNIPLYSEDTIERILEAIIDRDAISGEKAHIYIEFINEIVVVRNKDMGNYISKYGKDFKEALHKLYKPEVVKVDKVATKLYQEALRFL